MFKKILLTLLILNLFNAGFAQVKTPLEFIGKNKGKISVVLLQEEPFVAGRAFGRALGMQSTWFGASGQLELISGTKKAVLKKQQNFALVNKQKKALSQAPFEQGNILYVPLNFFNDFSSYDVAYTQDKIIVQRRYTLAFLQQDNGDNFTKIIFQTKGELPFRIEKALKDKVEIFFPGAVVKQDQVLSSKNNYLHRIRISQKAKGVQIAALLKKSAKHWDFYFNGKEFIFEAGAEPVKRTFEEAPTQTNSDLLRPSVLSEKETFDQEIIELEDDFFTALPEETSSVPAVSAVKVKPLLVPVVKKNGKFKILIDPGHGGKDPGAMRRGSAKEKDLNLKVAKQVYALLSKEKNIEVKMTRSDDTFISLGDRAKMSGKYDSDIFVSIHTNAAKKSSANGFEVYFRSDKASDAEAAQTAALENEALQYEGKTSGGLSFADLLLQSLATNENINQSSKLAAHIRLLAAKEAGKTGITVHNNSAIKQANFYVLKGVKCPAVLVEMGYISNASDRKRLNNKNTQNLIAKTIAKGILTYAKEEGWK